jgi:iron(III) transport system substrate-binding protein
VFTAKYGIEATAFRAATGPLQVKFQAEVSANNIQADVVQLTGVQSVMDTFASQGVWMDLTSLPAWKAYPTKSRTNTYAMVSGFYYEVAYNTDLVKASQLNTWNDLVDPRWKGRVAALDPSLSSSAQGIYVFLHEKLGDDFIRKMAALQLNFASGSTQAASSVAAGDKALAFGVASIGLNTLKMKGAPIDGWRPNPIPGNWHYAAATAKGPHPNAAKLFMNFLMSPEGQAAINNSGSGISPLPNVKGADSIPAGYEPLNENYSTEERNRVMQLLGK